MPELRTMTGRPAPQPIAVVAGQSVPLKIMPLQGEKMPYQVLVRGPGQVVVEALNNRMGPHFATFRLRGGGEGRAQLEIKPQGNAPSLNVEVQVQAAMALPDPRTDAGLLARVFLAEVPPPGDGVTLADARQAMTLIRVVLENRLAKPSGRWSSEGARNMGDVVRSPGQVRGFERYPSLSPAVTGRIDDRIAIANHADDGRQPDMRAFVEAAIAIASGPKPRDPSPTGLYWWRTKDHGPSGTGTSRFTTVLGNTFWAEGR